MVKDITSVKVGQILRFIVEVLVLTVEYCIDLILV